MSTLYDPHMHRCLDLARLGQGRVHPNPMVGAVVLDVQGQVIGEGYHTAYGLPHAEVMALDQATSVYGPQAAQGGTLIVNLEPCSHTGKTPPCVEKIIAAGIGTVISGMTDPNPKVAGQGYRCLQNAGIQVIQDVLYAECQQLNEAFAYAIQTEQPFLVAKIALTLDGKSATRSGHSQWISSLEARQFGHQLRAQSDAILSTAESVLQDNSQLTVRDAPLLGSTAPVRIILDRQGRLQAPDLKLFTATGPIWIITGQHGIGYAYWSSAATDRGVQHFSIPETPFGLNLTALSLCLGENRLTQVLVEAGGRFTSALFQAQLLQKLWLFYGPQILSDTAAQSAFQGGSPIWLMHQAQRTRIQQAFLLGDTLAVEAYPKP